MKSKFRVIMLMCALVVGLAATVSPALAQTYRSRRYYDGRSVASQQYRRYDHARRSNYDRRYDDRSVWERSRDKVTVAGGAGAGALVGALAGGKKGAIIGALVGAGGSALYTYKLRDRNRRFRR
jgi:hypothetical protein